ncbi:SDR family oxidoreductase [Sphingomonas bacterium]|uniref:SDR family oxidoreductase n=1 Tax=Sphingomonas bacterium TaxID=1895847 RepID=UPI001C2CEFB0|nr:SDR family oxidoreductase [Sphingomonas bacterium]
MRHQLCQQPERGGSAGDRGRGGGIAVQADVSDDAGCRILAKAAADAFGRIDFLVNNAGTGETLLVDAGAHLDVGLSRLPGREG